VERRVVRIFLDPEWAGAGVHTMLNAYTPHGVEFMTALTSTEYSFHIKGFYVMEVGMRAYLIRLSFTFNFEVVYFNIARKSWIISSGSQFTRIRRI